MKELTTEQKAQRYDEAIERANTLLSGNQLGNAWIYKLLPELKESENERIRKELIRETKGSEMKLFETITNEEFVAWLEKRGEQKPAWKPSGEQMKFLWKYAEQNNYDGRVLTSLYNDLKKLMEE